LLGVLTNESDFLCCASGISGCVVKRVPTDTLFSSSCITVSLSSSLQPQDEASASSSSAGASDAPPTPPPTPEETLRLRVVDLEAAVKSTKDQLLRALAEQENIRRIARVDVENATKYAAQKMAKSLLEVADNLGRAVDAVPADMRKSKEGVEGAEKVLANLFEGVSMTDAMLIKSFAANGIDKFGVVGEVFDPNLHECFFEYEDKTKIPGTIGQVMKMGYMLNKRVLRPAQVGTVKKSAA
jgi:molecular chaperone GrpE